MRGTHHVRFHPDDRHEEDPYRVNRRHNQSDPRLEEHPEAPGRGHPDPGAIGDRNEDDFKIRKDFQLILLTDEEKKKRAPTGEFKHGDTQEEENR